MATFGNSWPLIAILEPLIATHGHPVAVDGHSWPPFRCWWPPSGCWWPLMATLWPFMAISWPLIVAGDRSWPLWPQFFLQKWPYSGHGSHFSWPFFFEIVAKSCPLVTTIGHEWPKWPAAMTGCGPLSAAYCRKYWPWSGHRGHSCPQMAWRPSWPLEGHFITVFFALYLSTNSQRTTNWKKGIFS